MAAKSRAELRVDLTYHKSGCLNMLELAYRVLRSFARGPLFAHKHPSGLTVGDACDKVAQTVSEAIQAFRTGNAPIWHAQQVLAEIKRIEVKDNPYLEIDLGSSQLEAVVKAYKDAFDALTGKVG